MRCNKALTEYHQFGRIIDIEQRVVQNNHAITVFLQCKEQFGLVLNALERDPIKAFEDIHQACPRDVLLVG